MNTLYLKYAVEVERTGSISQAAENLFMAQPNLSKAIKELETDLGIEIFERSSRGVRLTPSGEEFLKYAENVLEQLEMMEGLSKKTFSDDSEFSLCIPYGCLSDKLIRLFNDAQSSLGAVLSEAGTVQTIDNVSDGSFKFGIIRYNTAFDELFTGYINERKLESVRWRTIDGVTLFSEKNMPCAQFISELFCGDRSLPIENMNKKIRANKTVVYGSAVFEILSRCPEMYMRCAPVSAETLTRFGLVQHVGTDEKYTERLVYRKGCKLSKADNKYIEKMYTSFGEIGTAL